MSALEFNDRPPLAASLSARRRQKADFRRTSQCRPSSSVEEVRELALPARNGSSLSHDQGQFKAESSLSGCGRSKAIPDP